MRALGLLLLFLGFGWMALLQFHLSATDSLRPVVIGQYQMLSKDLDLRYTRDQVQAHILDTAMAVRSHAPNILAPGVLMLLGGVLVVFGSRKRIDGAG